MQETIHVGGRLAIFIFICTLLAFVVESELTQYVQTTLDYRQPFFLFYIVHSSFLITFPLHILFLRLTTTNSIPSLLSALKDAIREHIEPASGNIHGPFPLRKFVKLMLALTMGISAPALLWFASVSLSSMTDITAIWNTNAFFAYLISVRLFHLKWEPRRLIAVVLATLGTFAVVYGGATASSPTSDTIATGHTPSNPPPSQSESYSPPKPTAPLLGNLLTLVAAFGYGLYQVLYKVYAALPNDPVEGLGEEEGGYIAVPSADGDVEDVPPIASSSSSITVTAQSIHPTSASTMPTLPFALHANLLTSLLGLCTLLTFWVLLPILHLMSVERFRLPGSTPSNPSHASTDASTTETASALRIWLSISGIASSGVVFNAGFMVLLGIWGPIVTSVGALGSVVGVLVADIFFGPGLQALTLWSVVGSGIIMGAFGVLVWDMRGKTKRKDEVGR